MTDVFVSYKREDLELVAPLVEGLRSAGLSVWWDRDIVPGAPWEETIERQLDKALAVVVAWSPSAVRSENVRSEARFARNRNRLVQLFVVQCAPPIFFGERQGIDFSDWAGDREDPRFAATVTAIRALLEGRAPAAGVSYRKRSLPRWRPAAVGAAIFISAVGTIFAAYYQRSSDVPSPVRSVPIKPVASARQNLLKNLSGNWDRQDGDCTTPTVINALADASRGEMITIENRKGFRSVGSIVAAENGAVITRDMTVSSSGRREQWEYRPVGNEMTVTDGNGIATKLVRCENLRPIAAPP